MRIAKAIVEGKTIYGLTDGAKFYYYVNRVAHIAYEFDPSHPTLSHFTNLVDIDTVDSLLKDISINEATSPH